MAQIDGNSFLGLLGLTAEDAKVKVFLSDCGITKQPKIKRGDVTDVLGNKDLGLEITFRDERHLDVKKDDYEEGALVLSNITMYGSGNKLFQRFQGPPPFGLSFDQKPDEANAALGKSSWQNRQGTLARWDRPGYAIFVSADSTREKITELSVQLPIA